MHAAELKKWDFGFRVFRQGGLVEPWPVEVLTAQFRPR